MEVHLFSVTIIIFNFKPVTCIKKTIIIFEFSLKLSFLSIQQLGRWTEGPEALHHQYHLPWGAGI